jgi:hypothetical protein
LADKQYWFKSLDKGGWSWGLPLVWQGWAVWIIFGLVCLANMFIVKPLDETWYWGVFGGSVFIVVLLHFLKGEPPKSRVT